MGPDFEQFSRYCDNELQQEERQAVEESFRTSARLRALVGQLRDLKRIILPVLTTQQATAEGTAIDCPYQNRTHAAIACQSQDQETWEHISNCPDCLRDALLCLQAEEAFSHATDPIPVHVLNRPMLQQLIRKWLLSPEYSVQFNIDKIGSGDQQTQAINTSAGIIQFQTIEIESGKVTLTLRLEETASPQLEQKIQLKLQRDGGSGKLLSFKIDSNKLFHLTPLPCGEYDLICEEPAFSIRLQIQSDSTT